MVGSASNVGAIPLELVAERLRSALRLSCPDRARRVLLAEASGVAERTLENYITGYCTPGLGNLFSIMRALGPAFVSDILQPIGMQASRIEFDDAMPDAEQLTAILRYGAQWSAAIERGHMNHRDRAALAPGARQLGCALIAWAAASEGEARAPSQ